MEQLEQHTALDYGTTGQQGTWMKFHCSGTLHMLQQNTMVRCIHWAGTDYCKVSMQTFNLILVNRSYVPESYVKAQYTVSSQLCLVCFYKYAFMLSLWPSLVFSACWIINCGGGRELDRPSTKSQVSSVVYNIFEDDEVQRGESS